MINFVKMKDRIQKLLNDLKDGKILKSNGDSYSKASVQFYTHSLNSIFNENDFNGDVAEFVIQVKENLRNRGCESVTENLYIRSLKWAFDHLGIDYNVKLRKIKEEDTMLIPDSERIVDMVMNFKPDRFHDAFRYIVSACFTSARYTDMTLWTDENIFGGKYLSYVPHKTGGKRIFVPLSDNLREVFNKEGYLLPRVDYHTLRYQVKRLFEMAGFTDEVKRIRYVGNKEVVETKEMWELMGLHRVRASAISGMLESGMREIDVKAFSGHSMNSPSFKRYVKLSQRHLDNSYSKYQSRFE